MSNEETISIAALAEVNPKVDLRRFRDDTPVSFIPMSDVTESGQWVNHQERRLDDARFGYTPFAEGDVLFAKITPCMENGKGAHAVGLKNGIGFGSTEFHVLRARGDTSARYLFHWLQARRTRTRAIAYMGGSAGQQRVQSEFFINFRVHRLDTADQSRIALVLDTVDEAIAKTEAVIAKLRQVRAGLLHDLLTRGLDPHGQLRDPIAHPEQFQPSPLGPIPKEWAYESLGERLQRIGGLIQTGPFGSQLHAHEYTSEGVPVIMPQDVLEGSVSVAQIARIPVARADELKRHRVKLGDLIFARRGDLSRCAAIVACEDGWLCGTGCLLMRFGESTLSPHWLSLAYRHDIGQRQIAARAVGTTMVNLNTTLLAHLRFAFPLKGEQDEVVQRVADADASIHKESANLSKLGLVKSGLMTDLLTGRVRVPAEKVA
jgi:type I restriction enzyme, S subunit